jgi:hypothetical protein
MQKCKMNPPCTYTPPEGQDITPYLVRLQSTLDNLNANPNNRLAVDNAAERIQLLISDITAVLEKT